MNDSPLTSKTTNKNKPKYASTGEYRRYVNIDILRPPGAEKEGNYLEYSFGYHFTSSQIGINGSLPPMTT